ncbi:hypothetical protein AB0K09_21365 [Streptomyces sp. NPDC049577]|uniref:hypothetical protein n=1 Tax=Streptomyces sp. NPDC049577 TaxID=3155153 RepID=UPI00342B03F1
MKSRTIRHAPAVAAITAGLLFAGTAGAVAAPSDDSPSAPSTPTSQADPSDPAAAHWDKRGHYDDENSCRQAGKDGQSHGKWHEYKCKREYSQDDYHYYWWLYTH